MYNALRVSTKFNGINISIMKLTCKVEHWNLIVSFIPIIQKFPGKPSSLNLLWVTSRISKLGHAPNPRPKFVKRFNLKWNNYVKAMWAINAGSVLHCTCTYKYWAHPTLRIRNFGNDETAVGSSSSWLLNKVRISRFTRFAIVDGIAVI